MFKRLFQVEDKYQSCQVESREVAKRHTVQVFLALNSLRVQDLKFWLFQRSMQVRKLTQFTLDHCHMRELQSRQSKVGQAVKVRPVRVRPSKVHPFRDNPAKVFQARVNQVLHWSKSPASNRQVKMWNLTFWFHQELFRQSNLALREAQNRSS